MGLLKAGTGAVGGVLADQWREFFYCDSLDANVLAAKGQKRTSAHGRSSNTKGEDNIISDGSIVAVNEGQCMIIVEQGAVVEVCAEPGEFVFESSSEPSVFAGNLGDSIRRSFETLGRRFTFGGDTGRDQRIYFFNTKEIVGNESQERMGLVMDKKDIEQLRLISERERAPFYVIGETTGDMQFTFVNHKTNEKPIDLKLEDMFGKAPRTIMNDHTVQETFAEPEYQAGNLLKYLQNVLQLEGVACKDWLTNKVDRSVTGRIAMQQTTGSIQLISKEITESRPPSDTLRLPHWPMLPKVRFWLSPKR